MDVFSVSITDGRLLIPRDKLDFICSSRPPHNVAKNFHLILYTHAVMSHLYAETLVALHHLFHWHSWLKAFVMCPNRVTMHQIQRKKKKRKNEEQGAEQNGPIPLWPGKQGEQSTTSTEAHFWGLHSQQTQKPWDFVGRDELEDWK